MQFFIGIAVYLFLVILGGLCGEYVYGGGFWQGAIHMSAIIGALVAVLLSLFWWGVTSDNKRIHEECQENRDPLPTRDQIRIRPFPSKFAKQVADTKGH